MASLLSAIGSKSTSSNSSNKTRNKKQSTMIEKVSPLPNVLNDCEHCKESFQCKHALNEHRKTDHKL